jgi:hypothetical protein
MYNENKIYYKLKFKIWIKKPNCFNVISYLNDYRDCFQISSFYKILCIFVRKKKSSNMAW